MTPLTSTNSIPQSLAGMTLDNVRLVERSMVVTFRGEIGELHLICDPQGTVDTSVHPPRVTVTGMTFTVATKMDFPAGTQQISGMAAVILRREVVGASLHEAMHTFGINLAGDYSVIINPMAGIQILKTQRIEAEFRAAVTLN